MDANKFEFGNFCQVAARFMLEEDEEGMREELKEAFRLDFSPSLRTFTRLIFIHIKARHMTTDPKQNKI